MLGTVLETDHIDDLDEILKNRVKTKVIEISKKENLSGFKEEVDDNGNAVINIPFNVQFILDNKQPEHLAYFVLTYLDLRELAKDFSLDHDTISFDGQNGEVVSEIVIDQNEIVSVSSVFLTEENEIWTGPVHLTRDGTWKTGSNETSESKFLRQEQIDNNKVQDFRIFSEIKRLDFDFNPVNAKIGNLEIKVLSNSHVVSTENSSYFSNFYITRDKNGDARFCFSINYEKLIIEKTQFGSLTSKANSLFLKELVEKTKIRRMSLFRRRVKKELKENRLNVLTHYMKFDPNEPDDFILTSRRKKFWRLQQNK